MILRGIQRNVCHYKYHTSKEDIKNYVNDVIKVIFDFESEKISNSGLYKIIIEYLKINYNEIVKWNEKHFEYTDLSQ